jgi:hypothetical protein
LNALVNGDGMRTTRRDFMTRATLDKIRKVFRENPGVTITERRRADGLMHPTIVPPDPGAERRIELARLKRRVKLSELKDRADRTGRLVDLQERASRSERLQALKERAARNRVR